MTGCSAVNCSNRSEQGFALKKFPKDPARRATWTTKVKRVNWVPTDNSYLCEEHFENDQWMDPIKKTLKKDAIPTIFSYAPPKSVKRKLPMKRPSPKRIRCEDLTYSSDQDNTVDMLKKKLEHSEKLVSHLKQENDKLNSKLKKQILKNAQYKWRTKCKQMSARNKNIFQEDQLLALNRKNMAYTKWSNTTVEKALSLRFACGSKGYEQILSFGLPFPSIRTLQRRLQNLKFESGVLHEVIGFLKVKVASFNEQEKQCVLVLDEMAITESVDFDMSTYTYFGDATSPFSGKASQVLTFMICGIATRWKQVIAYYFTNKESEGALIKDIILKLIEETDKIGLKIICVTSDMGSTNQAMWKAFGVSCTRVATKSFIILPSDPTRKIQFIADPPHLLKNIRSALLSNSHIVIPRNLKLKYELPTNQVTADHIKELTSFQENMDLKLAHKLTNDQLEQGHFDKMKVGPARTVLSHNVSCALQFLAEESKKKEMLATAWFVAHVSKWFDLVTSRSPKLALSQLNKLEYQKAIEFLLEIIDLFKHMKVVGKRATISWKPIQTGVILTTTSILELQKQLLAENFKFVLTSRFTQDSLENLFGIIRSKQVIPNAMQFKNNLKLVSVAQYLKKCNTGSYQVDDQNFLPGFLDAIKETPTTEKHVLVLPPDWDKSNHHEALSVAEQNCLFSIAGYIIHSLKKTRTVCQNCIASVAQKEKSETEYSRLVNLREYKSNCLYYVHEDVFEMFQVMELLFRSLEGILMKSENCKLLLRSKFEESSSLQSYQTQTCHNITQKILHRFANFRLKIFCTKKRKEIFANAKKSSSCMSSKSVGMRVLAKDV